MTVYCLNHSSITDAARYTLNEILENLGYFFQWTDRADTLDPADVLIVYGPAENKPGFKHEVIHLPQLLELEELHIRKVEWEEIKLNGSAIPVLSGSIFPAAAEGPLPVDLLANVYFHLSRIEELGYDHPEQIDENAEQSILFQYQKFRLPVVDILMDWFDDQIKKSFEQKNLLLIKKAAYPAAEKFGLALTHDVDLIRAYHPIKKIFLKTLIRLGIKKNLPLDKLNQNDRDYWAFDRLLKFYEQFNLRATFYFIARYREGLHWRYRVKSSLLKNLFRNLKKSGHEIGLHPSRFSFEKPANYQKEKNRLEKASQTDLSGMRHHYLRCLFPQMWQKLNDISLGYDAGMVYHNYSGFRAGTCRPFRVFNHKNKSELKVMEFPTAFFEKTLPENGNDKKAAQKIIEDLIRTTKKHNGLLTALWHTNNLYRPEVYPSFWEDFISMIQPEPVYIAPLRDQLNWIRQKRDICILSIKVKGQNKLVSFKIPAGLRQFTVACETDSAQFELMTPEVNMVVENNHLIFNTDGMISEIQLRCTLKNQI